eukprot:TRINITY_DN17_c2_g1_i1.p1 TRINITY_DN17_c2_g1~~TRINITY_DN17_c2_g1_i1.p1  ORF type:complete len:519 (+),score=162.14 TRINITY_DN17_c2_g1_i1:63-1619(+)
MTVELCASSRNQVPSCTPADLTSVVSVHVKGNGGNPVDVICVIDTSSSMSGAIGLVKTCMLQTVEGLNENDRMGVVCFACKATVELPLTKMTDTGRDLAVSVINENVRACGATDIEGALQKTFNLVGNSTPHKATSAVIIFLTDGNATSGTVRNRDGLLSMAEEGFTAVKDCHYKSVTCFTFGFGTSHDPTLLYNLANYGKGCYSFIGTAEEITPCLSACFRFSKDVVVSDMQLEIKPVHCTLKKIHTRYDTSRTTVDLADIHKHQERHILIDTTLLADDVEKIAEAHLSYYDVEAAAYKTASCDIIAPRGDSTEVNKTVEVHKMRLLTAQALERAGELCEKQLIDEASKLIGATRKVISDSCVKDVEECGGLMDDLRLCEQGLQHTTQMLSVASNMRYGNVGTAKRFISHNGNGGASQPDCVQPGATTSIVQQQGGEPCSVAAAYVTLHMRLLNEKGEPCRVVRKSLSKTGKHGFAKVHIEVQNLANGNKESLIYPTTYMVALYIADSQSLQGVQSN